MKTLLIIVLFVAGFLKSFSQNVSINNSGNPPDPSAQLDISATDKGILIPRMSAAERMLIASPAEGLLVYQNDAPAGFYFFDGTSWNAIGTAAPGSVNFSYKGSIAQGFNAGAANKVNFPIQNYLNNTIFANSIFTAPSPGIYSFSVNVNIYGNSATSAGLGFYVNNAARSTSTFNITSGVFQNIGYTDNLSLESGDEVTVQIQSSLYISGFAINFTGYKIN